MLAVFAPYKKIVVFITILNKPIAPDVPNFIWIYGSPNDPRVRVKAVPECIG